MVDWVTETVSELGYFGLAFLTFLENVFPPIPSELILPLGGFLVSQGELTLAGVILAGTAGSVGGGLVLYYLGKLISRERLNDWTGRYGKWLLLDREDVDRAFSWFERHGRKAVFFARLIPGVRSLISVPAGSSEMNLAPFLLYTALGTAIWSGALAYGGLLLGRQYEQLSQGIQIATYVVVGLLVLLLAWWVAKRYRARKK